MNGKNILITGGTGSFGRQFCRTILQKYKPKSVVVYSRDEMKQWEMAQEFEEYGNLRFVIGDVRDKERLRKASLNINYLVHAAATKIVPTAEYNPFECVKTNIIGAMNVIDACIENKIEKVVALSTDKASNPVNLYGATKLASDKLFIAGNNFFESGHCKFSVVRYGNVMGSRGSIIPYFLSLKNHEELPITDVRMTRFMITLEQGIDLVIHAFQDMEGGEIYVKKIPSMKVLDIARAISPSASIKIIGIRPGEKLHEQMIGSEDSPHTYDYANYFKVIPSIYNCSKDPKYIKGGKKVENDFTYTSCNNQVWMTSAELMRFINLYKTTLT